MDIFCQREKITPFIIDETSYFYILHDAYPLMEGHLLLIPKQHRSCFAELESDELKEFNLCFQNIFRFHTTHYGVSVQFEHGAIAQTVPHAHMHFLPTRLSVRETLLQSARLMAEQRIPYLYYGYMGAANYLEVIKPLPPGYIHSLYRSIITPYSENTLTAVNKVRKAWRRAFL